MPCPTITAHDTPTAAKYTMCQTNGVGRAAVTTFWNVNTVKMIALKNNPNRIQGRRAAEPLPMMNWISPHRKIIPTINSNTPVK